MTVDEYSETVEFQRLHSWLTTHVAKGPVAVVTGRNGDMDTIGSAVALASSNRNMLACGVHIGRTAQLYITKHQAPFRLLDETGTEWPKTLAAVVIVDAAAPDQTGLELPSVPRCIIDHHATDGWLMGPDDLHLKSPTRSTTEVVARYLEAHAPETLTGPVCEFLLAGIITDTGRFRHADAASLATAGFLVGKGSIDYQHFIQQMEDTPTTPSDRGALIKGLKRVETTEAGPWTILRTNAGTLEGRLASMLNGLGADAVVVTRSKGGSTRLTARAPRSSVASGLHLGYIMQEVAKSIGGDGGGHDGAAGWSGDVHPVAAETAFIDAVARASRKGVEQ